MNENLPRHILSISLDVMWSYWISSIIWPGLASGSCVASAAAQSSRWKKGRKAEDLPSRHVTQSTHSPKGKIRLLWDSAQEGVLSFDEKLFCKWICSYQAWRISEPPLFHYCWLMLRVHWVCTQNQIKSNKAWVDMFFSKAQLCPLIMHY